MTTPYVSASKTGQFLADRSEAPRPTAHALQLVFPMTHQQIVDAFRTKLRALRAAYPDTAFTDVPPLSAGAPSADAGEARRRNKIVAVIDSIARHPGDLLPWQEMIKVCREEGVWSVIDGAHSIGPEVSSVFVRVWERTLMKMDSLALTSARHSLISTRPTVTSGGIQNGHAPYSTSRNGQF